MKMRRAGRLCDSQLADYIKLRISERINRCSTTLVYLSGTTANSPRVKWEVEKSLELGKSVSATHGGENAPHPLPRFFEQKKIRVAPWSKLADEPRKK
jgi:hypothetical protein